MSLLAPAPELQPVEQAEVIMVDPVIVESANAILRRLGEETRALLTEHWAAVERVAQALMTYDLLDQAELDRLIAETSQRLLTDPAPTSDAPNAGLSGR